MSDWLTSTQLIGVYVLHGFAQLHMGLNIAHDANHGAYSKNKNVNRVLGYVFDLIGLSSYMWRLMHNDSHHFFVNVQEADSAIGYGGIFRVSPRMERRWYHRFQHIYAPFLYCLATLDWVFAKDYFGLLVGRFGNNKIHRHPRKELIILFAAKAFYYTYTLVLPLIFLSLPWYSIILGFTVMHLCLGFTLAVTFQPNHFTETSTFPELDEHGHITNNYIKHIFENTADYARGNPLACWALGGLNLHTVHHLFPNVCHVHYPALTEILRSTAQTYGLEYTEHKTITSAFIAHLKWMKILGKEDRSL
ncbi:MAG: fatty acid desaturase family protein [Saprospiraceae bacterium]